MAGTLTIKINCENDAFEPFWQEEALQILEKAKDAIYHSPWQGPYRGSLLDSNGNHVGTVEYSPADRERCKVCFAAVDHEGRCPTCSSLPTEPGEETCPGCGNWNYECACGQED
jgi:hypothetical protein